MNNAKKNQQYVIAVDVMFKVYYMIPILDDVEAMSYVRKSAMDGGYWMDLRGMEVIKSGEEDFFRGSVCGK